MYCVRNLLFCAFVVSASVGVWRSVYYNGPDLEAAQQYDTEHLEGIRLAIEQEIGVPTASAPSQCKLIGFGSKPCGGPWRYLVYSTAKTDESKLEELVRRYNAAQKKINEERRIYSDCALASKPSVEVIDGICTATELKPRKLEKPTVHGK